MSPEAAALILEEKNVLKNENESLHNEVEQLTSKIQDLQDELAYLRRQIYGQKRERFIPGENQIDLPLEFKAQSEPETEPQTEVISYKRRKGKKGNKGREDIPAHLPRHDVTIKPDGDTTGMNVIYTKQTEQLEYTPASFYVTRINRPVYAGEVNGERTILCAPIPPLCIDKGKAGPSLVAHTVVAKCEDHMPIYRVLKQVNRDCGMALPQSSVEDWFNTGAFWASALTKRMEEVMKDSDYLQIDESYLKVMIHPTDGKSTQGYMWVRHDPIMKIALFNFDKKHNSAVALKLIGEDFEGIIQSDGLNVYDFLEKREKVKHAGCNGHARRKFEKELKNDKTRAEYALGIYRKIFNIERVAEQKGYSPEERLRLRQEKSAPVMAEFKEWLKSEILIVPPKSKMGLALGYAYGRWKELTLFLEDGLIEVSNNWIENIIRPLALGRRNWLFAGSENGAERLAALYSVILTCKLHNVNSFKYLSDVFRKLPLRKNGSIDDLLPWNWIEPTEENKP